MVGPLNFFAHTSEGCTELSHFLRPVPWYLVFSIPYAKGDHTSR